MVNFCTPKKSEHNEAIGLALRRFERTLFVSDDNVVERLSEKVGQHKNIAFLHLLPNKTFSIFQFIEEQFHDINSIIAVRGFKRNQYPFQHMSGYSAIYTKLIDAITVRAPEVKDIIEYLVNDIVLCRGFRDPLDMWDLQSEFPCLEAVSDGGFSRLGNHLVTLSRCNAFTKIADPKTVAELLNLPDILGKVDLSRMTDVEAIIQVLIYCLKI